MSRRSFNIEELQAVGGRIRAVRGRKTQAEFAKEIGVSRTALANYEMGKRLPNRERLSLIAVAGAESVGWILFGGADKAAMTPDQSSLREGPTSLRSLASRLRVFVDRYKSAGFGPPSEITADEYILLRALRFLRNGSELKKVLAPLRKLLERDDPICALFDDDDLERLREITATADFDSSESPDDLLMELEGAVVMLNEIEGRRE